MNAIESNLAHFCNNDMAQFSLTTKYCTSVCLKIYCKLRYDDEIRSIALGSVYIKTLLKLEMKQQPNELIHRYYALLHHPKHDQLY